MSGDRSDITSAGTCGDCKSWDGENGKVLGDKHYGGCRFITGHPVVAADGKEYHIGPGTGKAATLSDPDAVLFTMSSFGCNHFEAAP